MERGDDAGQGDGGKLGPELIHGQIQGFARLLHAIKAMSAGQLKGA